MRGGDRITAAEPLRLVVLNSEARHELIVPGRQAGWRRGVSRVASLGASGPVEPARPECVVSVVVSLSAGRACSGGFPRRGSRWQRAGAAIRERWCADLESE
jgi:hypothetical protein